MKAHIQQGNFFSKDREFYKSVFSLMIVVALQNLVAYSVNMADNLMLGSYSQDSLSGAATVNQIFFIVQQISLSLGEALIVLNAQYWGKKSMEPIRKLTAIALKLGVIAGIIIVIVCGLFPYELIHIFTNDPAIIQQGVEYLSIIKYTFLLFIITNLLMAALRSVETAKISFYISIVSLLINVAINYVLIFGRFGAPELGIKGAAIGTLIARIIETVIVLLYLLRIDQKIKLFGKNFWTYLFRADKQLRRDYRKVMLPVLFSQLIWAISVPMQTAILGHLSSDAIAANSVATTFYQYLKVVVSAMSSVCSVMIGRAIGRGNIEEVMAENRTLNVLCLAIGAVLGVLLFTLSGPLLKLYDLNANTLHLAHQLMMLLSVIMVTMSYQMPASMGCMRGGGDTKFPVYMNIICVWCIVMPLSFLSAFVWHWPVVWVVLMIQLDQIIKCVPVFIRIRKYDKWVKNLTR